MTLGSKLKDARKRKGLTQRQLADLISAKHNSISNWENDQNRPDPDTIEVLCKVLDIEPNWLLSDANIPIKNIAVANYLKDGQADDLPEEAKREIENFIEYIKSKYKKD